MKRRAANEAEIDARLGEVYQKMGKHSAAIRYFQSALMSRKDDVKIEYKLAKSYYAVKDYQKARGILEKHVKERGQIKIQEGETQVSAMMDLEIYKLYAKVLDKMGDRNSAIEAIKSLVKRNQSNEVCNMVLDMVNKIGVGDEAEKVSSLCQRR